MVKLSLTNLSSKAGKRISPPEVTDLCLKGKQLDDIGISMRTFSRLLSLDLSMNRFQFERQLAELWNCPVLVTLDLRGNPICKQDKQYRLKCVANLHRLQTLDGTAVTPEERAAAWTAFPDLRPAENHDERVSSALQQLEAETKALKLDAERKAEREIEQAAEELERRRAEVAADKQRIMEAEARRKKEEDRERRRKAKLVAEARALERGGTEVADVLGDSDSSSSSSDNAAPGTTEGTGTTGSIDQVGVSSTAGSRSAPVTGANSLKTDAKRDASATRNLLFGGDSGSSGGGGGASLFGLPTRKKGSIFDSDDEENDGGLDEVDRIFGQSVARDKEPEPVVSNDTPAKPVEAAETKAVSPVPMAKKTEPPVFDDDLFSGLISTGNSKKATPSAARPADLSDSVSKLLATAPKERKGLFDF